MLRDQLPIPVPTPRSVQTHAHICYMNMPLQLFTNLSTFRCSVHDLPFTNQARWDVVYYQVRVKAGQTRFIDASS